MSSLPKLQREALHTDQAPAAVGPYSQAVRVDRTIYISGNSIQSEYPLTSTSGQIPFDPVTMKKVDGDIQAETHQVMKNLEAILKNAGCDFSNGNCEKRRIELVCFMWLT